MSDRDALARKLRHQQVEHRHRPGNWPVLECIRGVTGKNRTGSLDQFGDWERTGVRKAIRQGNDTRRASRTRTHERWARLGDAPGEQGSVIGVGIPGARSRVRTVGVA